MSDQAKSAGNVAPLPSKHSFKPLKACTTLEEAFQTHEFMERIQASVPQHVQPGRMLRTFVSAVSKTPLLAQANLRTFLGACLTCSQVGLEPNTPLGHIWLIPFKTKYWNPQTRKRDKEVVEINVIFGYPGLLDLSYRTTKVKAVHADVVWPGDEFSFEYGTNAHLKHCPRGHKPDDRPLYAYMHAGLDGGQAFEVMPYDDILSIRNKSQAYRFALAAKEEAEAEGKRVPRTWLEAPWVAHEIAMSRKTAFRAGSKWLPRSVELASAIAIDEAQDRRRRMDFGTAMDAPTIDGTPDYLSAVADEAQRPDEGDEGEPSGVDPGTAYGDRRAVVATGKAAVVDKATTQPNPKSEPSGQPATLAFEAILIDANGTPDNTSHTDPFSFAQAILARYEKATGPEADALLEHNADALDEARQDPRAAKLLAALDGSTESQTEIPVVEPPVERGKTSWVGYVRMFKAALNQVGPAPAALHAWLLAQRETLAKVPMGQRVLAIQAVSASFGTINDAPPAWLGEMMRPSATRADPPTKRETDAASQNAAPNSDELWVDRTIAELGAITTEEAFQTLVKAGAVQHVMARLQRENRALFDRADAAFLAKHQALQAE